MLEFIVLGQIPGTQFQVTFSWVMAIVACLLFQIELQYHKSHGRRFQKALEAISI